MTVNTILQSVEQYYNEKVEIHGATPKGVDWNSLESQEFRFRQLLKICQTDTPFSINDYGCGYGALLNYLVENNYPFEYHGFDIAPAMVARAKEMYATIEHCEFFTDANYLVEADYTVASGIFNVKLNSSEEEWQTYILHTLDRISEISKKGFAFNVLTKYSDADRMRPDLHYADPLFLFDHCKRRFSKYVALLHDYPLYEFTMLVRKEI